MLSNEEIDEIFQVIPPRDTEKLSYKILEQLIAGMFDKEQELIWYGGRGAEKEFNKAMREAGKNFIIGNTDVK